MSSYKSGDPIEVYSTGHYFNITVIDCGNWKLKRRKDEFLPKHFRSMVFHTCHDSTDERYMNGLPKALKCNGCRELMPDEIQVIWTFMNLDLIGYPSK